jgi:alkanesulfonate monooxygenase SsuD/methylene tetrahydromethanopterin reductase-like flavin-dependent oxidoreductase (luciferase family)
VQRPRVPLLIGGMGVRRTLPLVARFADEWNATTNSPSLLHQRGLALDGLCAAIGRQPSEIRRSVAVGLLIWGSDRERERRCDRIRPIVPDLAAFDVDEVPDAARTRGWVCGTPDEVVEALQALEAAGAERAMLQHNDWEDEEALALVAREIIPALA